MQPSVQNPDPRFHTANVKKMLDDLIGHLRDTRQVSEPKAQVLFEKSCEVLKRPSTAFTHYEEGKEPGMRQ